MPSIDTASISPGDAAAALRSYPRRWRGVWALVEDDDVPAGALDRRPPDGSPSASEHLAATVGLLSDADEALRLGLVQERPIVERGSSPTDASPDDLTTPAEALAGRIDAVPADDWNRVVSFDGRERTVLDVVRHAVAEASDQLRQAERAVRQAIGH